MGGPHVGIVSIEGDFHADVVALRLREIGCRVSVFAIDGLPSTGRLSWELEPGGAVRGAVRTVDREQVRPADLDVVWWRRNGHPQVPAAVRDPDARRVVESDTHAAAYGLFATAFTGAWVSDPDATRRAENKLVQLRAAAAVGLRVPRTLVSQDPDDIRAFVADVRGPVIAKTVAGALGVPLSTGVVDSAMLANAPGLALSPAIYQECIPGRRHLRVCCFGADVHAVLLDSPTLDWRYVRGIEAARHEMDPALAALLISVLHQLGLRMGVFDLKLDDDGDPVWLEVNPQGQFLFLEGMCGIPLGRIAAEFLRDEAGSTALLRSG